MYLPRSLPLCDPHLHTWVGDGGRRYDFVVSRPVTSRLDEPAVYILVKQEGSKTIPLYIGQTSSLSRWFGPTTARCPEVWRRALAMGMTHVHLRFEACSERARQAEVRDLVAAVGPLLNESLKDEPQPQPASASRSASGDRSDVLVTYRPKARAGSPVRQEPILHAAPEPEAGFVPRLPLRADPARDEDPEFYEDIAAVQAVPATPVPDRVEEVATVEPEMTAPTAPEISPLSMIEVQSWSSVDASPPTTDSSPTESITHPVVIQRSPRLLDRLVHRVVERMASWRVGFMDGHVAGASAVATPAEFPADSAATETHTDQPVVSEAMTEETGSAEAAIADTPAPPTPSIAPVASAAPTASPTPQLAEELNTAAPAVATVRRTDAQTECEEDAKRGLELDPSAPVVLFAGDVSYAAGADILFDAMVIVCGDHHQVQCVFAGDGALRAELQERANAAGLAGRCRFLGDVAAARFEQVLAACDFVAIPARVKQGEELARLALGHGKPVLITHQAEISGVIHGENGLVTYDNPGSFVWGVRELLGPLYGSLRRHLAEAA